MDGWAVVWAATSRAQEHPRPLVVGSLGDAGVRVVTGESLFSDGGQTIWGV